MSRIDFSHIPALHAAARRHRAESIARLFAVAFAWLTSRKRAVHAPRPHFAK